MKGEGTSDNGASGENGSDAPVASSTPNGKEGTQFKPGQSGNPAGRNNHRRDAARTDFIEGFVDWFLGRFRHYPSKRAMQVAHAHYAQLWKRAQRQGETFNHLIDKLMESATPPAEKVSISNNNVLGSYEQLVAALSGGEGEGEDIPPRGGLSEAG